MGSDLLIMAGVTAVKRHVERRSMVKVVGRLWDGLALTLALRYGPIARVTGFASVGGLMETRRALFCGEVVGEGCNGRQSLREAGWRLRQWG